MKPPTRRALALLVLSACSTDYGVTAKPDPEAGGGPTPLDLGPPESSGTTSTTPPCEAEIDVPDEVVVNEACAIEVAEGGLNATLEWELPTFSSFGEYNQILMAPLVAQLTDDNGDGVADAADVPDIIVVTDDEGQRQTKRGVLRWIPGDGTGSGGAIQRVDRTVGDVEEQIYPYRYSNAAVADVDGDGQPEIIAIVEVVVGGLGGSGEVPPSDGGEDTPPEDTPVSPGLPISGEDEGPICHAAAFRLDNTVAWVSPAELSCGGHAPAIADLEGDGVVEVIVGNTFINGEDGEVLAVGEGGVGAYDWHPEVGWHAVPMDLNNDGLMEVVTGRTIYSYDGSTRCDFGDDALDGFVSIADFNLDGMGEVVSVGDTTARVFDHNCVVSTTFALVGEGNGGMPAIGDFDQDGTPEIGVPTGSAYAVYEADGTVVWAATVVDGSSAVTGSAAYDFEGDGQLEVVYADEQRLTIYDGTTGEVRYSSDRHASRTLHELPTVADVDGDGEAEIIIPNGGGHASENKTGLWVLGSDDGSWMPGRMLWNQHAYSITNINDDLSVPAPALPNWPAYNTFRSGSLLPSTSGEAADAVGLADVCLDECEDNVLVVYVRVGNGGMGALRTGLPVSVYAQDVAGYRTFRTSTLVDGFITPGQTSALIRLEVDWTGYNGQDVVVVVDDDWGLSVQPECDETNNELLISNPPCAGEG
ncbi:MAG: VCBS repeat-containing protein [Deltaproteobacteria bacterium]|nr:VCBS repeat-containing protein [Deltaproteobacteria bacterium]